MNGTLLLCILLGAALWLDRVYLLQILVSRPIVMAPLLGLVLGEMTLGLVIGAALELIWLNAPPVGGFLAADESFCAAVAVPVGGVAAAVLEPQAAAGLALFLSLPTAFIGRAIDTRIRRLNQGLLPETALEDRLSGVMFKALLRAFLMTMLALGLCAVVLGGVAHLLMQRLPSAAISALAFLPTVGIIIGLAGLAGGRGTRPRTVWTGVFALGMGIVILWQWMP